MGQHRDCFGAISIAVHCGRADEVSLQCDLQVVRTRTRAMFDDGVARGEATGSVTRRVFLFGAAAAIVAAVAWRYEESQRAAVKTAPDNRPATVAIVEFSSAGTRIGLAQVARVRKSEDEWRAQLGRGVYEIARQGDTEYAYSGEYWDLDDKGLFRCVCCQT